jgi:hypothetical protein
MAKKRKISVSCDILFPMQAETKTNKAPYCTKNTEYTLLVSIIYSSHLMVWTDTPGSIDRCIKRNITQLCAHSNWYTVSIHYIF